MTGQGSASGEVKGVFSDAEAWSSCTDENGEPLIRIATILFVEDEVFVRGVTFEVLQSAGYRVLTAKDADEALRIYDEHGSEIDLLLTDVILPGDSGFGMAAKIRRENPGLSVLFVTGYAEQMAIACEKEGEECLAKPFSSEGLLRRVRELLDGIEARNQMENLAMLAVANA